MNEIMKQIATACVPILCLLIAAGGKYLVTLIKVKNAQLQQQLDNQNARKYMDMASDAVVQAVTYISQTYVDALKKDGAFTKENQIEAFNMAKAKALAILGDTARKALGEIYGDFDAWLDTKIEQVCRETKAPSIEWE